MATKTTAASPKLNGENKMDHEHHADLLPPESGREWRREGRPSWRKSACRSSISICSRNQQPAVDAAPSARHSTRKIAEPTRQHTQFTQASSMEHEAYQRDRAAEREESRKRAEQGQHRRRHRHESRDATRHICIAKESSSQNPSPTTGELERRRRRGGQRQHEDENREENRDDEGIGDPAKGPSRQEARSRPTRELSSAALAPGPLPQDRSPRPTSRRDRRRARVVGSRSALPRCAGASRLPPHDSRSDLDPEPTVERAPRRDHTALGVTPATATAPTNGSNSKAMRSSSASS